MQSKKLQFTLIMLLLVVFAVFGCVSFKSIQATAELGKEFGTHQNDLKNLEYFCMFQKKYIFNNLDCEYEKKMVISPVNFSVKVLSGYAYELIKQVDKQTDIEPKDAVKAALSGLSEVEWKDLKSELSKNSDLISKALGEISDLVFTTIKKNELQNTIKTANEPLLKIRSNTKGIFNAYKVNEDIIWKDLGSRIGYDSTSCGKAITDQKNPNCTDACNPELVQACEEFKKNVDIHLKKMNEYYRALDAFVTAHEKLAAESKSLGEKAKDKQLYLEILKSAQEIYKSGEWIFK